ncbi:MAG: TonB-dependent receptor [Gammaproteobacteria bacterium]|nr:TonB-dependent receptor [Gammaproteobacteria bacterium]
MYENVMAKKLPSLFLTFFGVLISSSPIAMAQDSEGVGREALEEVVVTGSRIAIDPNLVGSTPVQFLNADDLKLAGEINLGEIIKDIPALLSSTTAENTQTGANALNLRGMGTGRTLTLVNGRRHVAGFRGSQAVDIGSIPRGLVERVEVTTGGASAVYGSDAVTGVVNFVLKDKFEGSQIDLRGGISGEGDAENLSVDVLWGDNFADGRGNVVFAMTIEDDSTITHGDRVWSRNNGIAITQTNPEFLKNPNAPPRAVINDARFWLTSQAGSIAPGGFSAASRTRDYGVDINRNGILDCQESAAGRDRFLAGCWVTNPDGTVDVFKDGVVLNGLWSIGGMGGAWGYFDRDTLYPETDRVAINLNTSFEATANTRLFFEGKFVTGTSTDFNEQDTYWDTLVIQADNPFIPKQLLPVANRQGYLLLTKDPLDISDDNPLTYRRETVRLLAGVQFEPFTGHQFEVAANYGQFTNTSKSSGVYLDRLFAAMDAVRAPNGTIVCRSDLDPKAFYEIDYFTGNAGFANGDYFSNRYYTFKPGDGKCKPLNPFGVYAASKEAQQFVTANLVSELVVEQKVFSASAAGQFDILKGVLDGPIGYAAGVEYRDESSDNRLDPLTLGILPEGTSLTPGKLVKSIDPWVNSFLSIDNVQQFDTGGGYDVTDAFAEIRLPIFRGRMLAEEFSLDGAVRLADYSTLGETTTWKAGLSWAPISGLTFRGTISEAVRAPNISELFDPKLPIFIAATADPCDKVNVTTGSAARQANCVAALRAAGVPASSILGPNNTYVWNNPLTGRFAGTSGGNPNLNAETAETYTAGFVFVPSFIDGLSVTVDYWDVAIEEAVSAVSANDILQGCFDSDAYPNVPFCGQFSRRPDGGLRTLDSGLLNFARLEATGVDFAINYKLPVGKNVFGVRLVGSQQENLDRFFNPRNPADIDPEVEEIQLPKWNGNLNLTWNRGPIGVGVQMSYQSKQAVAEIQDVRGLYGKKPLYGDAGFFDAVTIFDVNANYEFSESLNLYGGVNNVADEEPYSTQLAWPVGPRGRFFFLGMSYKP